MPPGREATTLSHYPHHFEPLLRVDGIERRSASGAMWVLDDPTVGLDKEPFVSGAEYKAIILHILHLVQCIE